MTNIFNFDIIFPVLTYYLGLFTGYILYKNINK